MLRKTRKSEGYLTARLNTRKHAHVTLFVACPIAFSDDLAAFSTDHVRQHDHAIPALLCMCQVSSALDNENSTPAELIHAFEQVELEIFKLLAYDPFLRFKRQVVCMVCG